MFGQFDWVGPNEQMYMYMQSGNNVMQNIYKFKMIGLN